MRARCLTLVRGLAAAVGVVLTASSLAASPPCTLSPLWHVSDPEFYNSVGAVGSVQSTASDTAGNWYGLRIRFAIEGEFLDLVSYDQNGNRRFRTPVTSFQFAFQWSGIAIVGPNVFVVHGDPYEQEAHLLAYRTSDGALAWSRDLIPDLRKVALGTITRVNVGTPARGNGYLAVPLSYDELRSNGQVDRRDVVGAYRPESGALIGMLQSAPTLSSGAGSFVGLVVDEPGNLYIESRGFNGATPLTSWQSWGNFRFSVPGISELLGVGSGILVAGEGGHHGGLDAIPFQVVSTANGAVQGSSVSSNNGPMISGTRLTFVECAGKWGPYECESAALTTYDLPTASLRWRTALTDDPTQRVAILDPILTSVGSVVLLQELGTAARIREFDPAGREYVSCDIPNGRYQGFTIAGNRFMVWQDGDLWAFDSYGHTPAPKGWVMKGGSPQNDGRPR